MNAAKKAPDKGCLLLPAGISLCSISIVIGTWLDCPCLRNLGIMTGGFAGSFAGRNYIKQKKTPAWQWVAFFILTLIMTALLTVFLESNGRK